MDAVLGVLCVSALTACCAHAFHKYIADDVHKKDGWWTLFWALALLLVLLSFV